MSDLETFRRDTRAWLEANCPLEMREPLRDEKDACWGGRNFTFQSQAQKAYLNWLLNSTTVVPITGRTSASYRRLTLGLKGHAITCFGATILDGNGRPNLEWTSRMVKTGTGRRCGGSGATTLAIRARVIASRNRRPHTW